MLVLLAGTIAFSASKMLYGDKALGKIIVGVVVPENDRLSEMAMNMVASLDSVGSLCEFTYTDKEEGTKLLGRGEIFALMELPPGLLEGSIDGSNIPVTITFPDTSRNLDSRDSPGSHLQHRRLSDRTSDAKLNQAGRERFEYGIHALCPVTRSLFQNREGQCVRRRDDSRILWDIGCRHDSAASWNPCGPYRAPL